MKVWHLMWGLLSITAALMHVRLGDKVGVMACMGATQLVWLVVGCHEANRMSRTRDGKGVLMR